MIKILVDTSSDYTVEEIQAQGMELVPLHITMNGKDYRDAYDLSKDEFFEMQKECEEFPKTSQPTPQDFVEIFEKAKEAGDELICILLSTSLSGTFQSAALAKNIVEYDKIHLVDSLTATHMIRILADHAEKLAKEGKSAQEIVEALENLKGRVKVLFSVDTLEYLYKGGRLSKAAAALGEMARIKPLLTVTPEGEVGVVGKCMGRNKAISSLTKMLTEREIDPEFPMYSAYTYGTENVEAFEKRLEETGFHIVKRQQVGATIAAHLGAGVCGVFFVEK